MHNLSPEARAALDAGDIDALLAFHKLTFGGYVMEDEGSDDEGSEDENDDEGTDEGTNDEGSDDDDAGDGDDDDELGEKGQRALERMKATVKELKASIRELKTENAKLRKADDGEEDELTSARKETETERNKRVEAEKKLAAKMHNLPDSWAARLVGDDFDDFLDDAEALAADLPANPTRRKGGGGARDGSNRPPKTPSLNDQIAEAEKKGDHATARRLKAQMVHKLAEAS